MTYTDGSGSPKEIRRLERIAENTLNEEDAKSAMVILMNLNPTYHWCGDWDEAVICDKSNEWGCCTCDLGEHSRLKKLDQLTNELEATKGYYNRKLDDAHLWMDRQAKEIDELRQITKTLAAVCKDHTFFLAFHGHMLESELKSIITRGLKL
jgi:hypothetical protein